MTTDGIIADSGALAIRQNGMSGDQTTAEHDGNQHDPVHSPFSQTSDTLTMSRPQRKGGPPPLGNIDFPPNPPPPPPIADERRHLHAIPA